MTETTLRVRYAETDQMGHAYYANYLVWFEVARTDWCRQRGIPYSELEARGYFLPVVEAHVSYKREVLYDDELRIETTISEVRRASMRFDYKVFRGETLTSEGHTVHVLMGAERRAVTIPDDLRAILTADAV